MILLQRFQQTLRSLSQTYPERRYLIAYSGGVDSHVLLHLCHSAGIPLRAIHIHHGLQVDADTWEQHCQSVCNGYDIPYHSVRVDAESASRESPEEVARDVRYSALYEALEHDEILLLAQHKNDQAETVLLQMLRGAGTAGLSAMPQTSRLDDGRIQCRPLLGVTRAQIESYAAEQNLQWIEDPSNQDDAIKRNLLRNRILPLIEQSWPQAVEHLAQVAEQQQSARQLIDELARTDLANAATEDVNSLSMTSLDLLDDERLFNLLRYWLHRNVSRPNRNCIRQIIDTVIPSSPDASASVRWSDFEVRRYHNVLYLLRQQVCRPIQAEYEWQPRSVLVIPELESRLTSVETVGGLDNKLLDEKLMIRFREGGEIIRPRGDRHHHELKKLFQQAGIPPWLRNRIPLIYLADRLIAVSGYWLEQEYCVASDKDGWLPQLTA